MIVRLSEKLRQKIHAGPLPAIPLDDNRLADWTAHLFVANRTQYVLVSNTKSLYSTVLPGKGIANDRQFIERVLGGIRDFMQEDGQALVFRRLVAPASETVRFAKALDRSVTGSMNDLVYHAKMWLIEDELSPFDVGFKLNDIPFSSLKYAQPREAFQRLAREQ